MNNLAINPQIRTLKSLMDEIKVGRVCVPPFQRDFVWTREQIRDLFVSIQRNYPIGSILLWKPNKRYEWTQNYTIGKYLLDNTDVGDIYILDGYQRLSSIFSCLVNPNLTSLHMSSEVDKSLFDLYYDLSDESFIYLRSSNQRKGYQVPLYVFMSTSEFRKYSRSNVEPYVEPEFLDVYLDRADELSRKLIDYQIACVEIKGADIEEAVDIFSRLNSKGVEISLDGMVNALSYTQDFRFADIMDKLIEDIADSGFGQMKRDMLFRCFQSSFGKLYFDQSEVEKLAKRSDFRDVILDTNKCIMSAILFLQHTIKMPDYRFLPYGTQLIFIVEFFRHYPDPSLEQLNAIEEWFWATTYSNYFTINSLGEQRKAYNHFVRKLNEKEFDDLFYPERLHVTYESLPFPSKIQLGSVRSDAVCLFIENHFDHLLKDSQRRTSALYSKILENHKQEIVNEECKFVEKLGFSYGAEL